MSSTDASSKKSTGVGLRPLVKIMGLTWLVLTVVAILFLPAIRILQTPLPVLTPGLPPDWQPAGAELTPTWSQPLNFPGQLPGRWEMVSGDPLLLLLGASPLAANLTLEVKQSDHFGALLLPSQWQQEALLIHDSTTWLVGKDDGSTAILALRVDLQTGAIHETYTLSSGGQLQALNWGRGLNFMAMPAPGGVLMTSEVGINQGVGVMWTPEAGCVATKMLPGPVEMLESPRYWLTTGEGLCLAQQSLLTVKTVNEEGFELHERGQWFRPQIPPPPLFGRESSSDIPPQLAEPPIALRQTYLNVAQDHLSKRNKNPGRFWEDRGEGWVRYRRAESLRKDEEAAYASGRWLVQPWTLHTPTAQQQLTGDIASATIESILQGTYDDLTLHRLNATQALVTQTVTSRNPKSRTKESILRFGVIDETSTGIDWKCWLALPPATPGETCVASTLDIYVDGPNWFLASTKGITATGQPNWLQAQTATIAAPEGIHPDGNGWLIRSN